MVKIRQEITAVLGTILIRANVKKQNYGIGNCDIHVKQKISVINKMK